MRVWTRFGGSEIVVGILAAAAFVALPTGLPLAEVLARWVPALHGHGAALPVLVTVVVWGCLSAWLLAGAHAQLVRMANTEMFEATRMAPAPPTPIHGRRVAVQTAGVRRAAHSAGRVVAPAA